MDNQTFAQGVPENESDFHVVCITVPAGLLKGSALRTPLFINPNA
jgi:hypothetical protein